MQFCYGIQCFFSNVHGSDGIFSLRSTRGGLTGVRSCIVCRESFILLFPGTVMLHSSHSLCIMQLVASLVSVLLLVWSVRATALPGDERLAIQSTREQSTVRKDAILKMLAGLLDGVDMGREVASPAVDEEEGKVEEERAVLGRLAQLSPRDRKAPCKNFFWKTFTSC
ncbi:cortistatin isoform X1 [Neopsephotus bourkii]|uniref:cortistatin isoform X1 n=2 Tax=Neopsephotus bourkii TaxID=309878 RepID=UPI002AA55445|nr:cortistatin isoform X1 [Neopsephotus bourkii]